jgi:hypothetical protein
MESCGRRFGLPGVESVVGYWPSFLQGFVCVCLRLGRVFGADVVGHSGHAIPGRMSLPFIVDDAIVGSVLVLMCSNRS